MAAPPPQLVTLQFGGVANWAGAHFWNLQVRVRGGGVQIWVEWGGG